MQENKNNSNKKIYSTVNLYNYDGLSLKPLCSKEEKNKSIKRRSVSTSK